jgi:hypothetical protein
MIATFTAIQAESRALADDDFHILKRPDATGI